MPPARLLPALLLLAASVVAPLARAQDVGVEADALPFPLKPLTETGTSEVRVRAPCGEDVAFTVEPSTRWMRASVDPPTFPSPACEGEWRAEATLRVQVDELAPAMEPATLIVRAHAGPRNASAHVEVRAAFVGVLDVQANQTETTVAPQRTAVFDVAITNRGNGNAKVTFDAVHPPSIQVPVPNSIILQPGQRVMVPVMVQTRAQNGYVNEVDVVTVTLTSAHALHPDQKGDSETLTFTVRTQGAYAPGPAPWLALAGAALVLKRRLGKP